ncbi:hypothetical protein BRADI_2g12050v3 [Brachypodium distachyon]|uniref:Uncharacterized protein n=1 Tax=Brachypodium distachyon TaxID=15368 RepID=A0A2K2D837_BRADI|nr:hypothetical protein BRADI_2g12050v3 [Brachypodium distachyon]
MRGANSTARGGRGRSSRRVVQTCGEEAKRGKFLKGRSKNEGRDGC